MTGPEHYREAERLLEPGEYDETADAHLVMRDLARAQAHATLALAAATALCQPTSEGLIAPCEWKAWNAAAGAEKP